MRNPVAILLSVLFTASLCVTSALADAKGDVLAAVQNFGSVKSVHASISGGGNDDISFDMVEPNKVSGTNAQGIRFVDIGSNMWINTGNGWQSYPAGAALAHTQMEIARGSAFQKSILQECTITDAGMSSVSGTPARKYHIVNKSNGTAWDLWIANGLPIKFVGNNVSITWSNYNSVADIKPPV